MLVWGFKPPPLLDFALNTSSDHIREPILTESDRNTRALLGQNNCVDGVLDIDFNLINLENFSFNPKVNIQSLTNRGTQVGEGISLGFKAAKKISPN